MGHRRRTARSRDEGAVIGAGSKGHVGQIQPHARWYKNSVNDHRSSPLLHVELRLAPQRRVDRIELLAAKQEIVSAHVPDDVSVRVDDLALRGLGDQAAAGLLEVPSVSERLRPVTQCHAARPGSDGRCPRPQGPLYHRESRKAVPLRRPVPSRIRSRRLRSRRASGHGHQRNKKFGLHGAFVTKSPILIPPSLHVLEPRTRATRIVRPYRRVSRSPVIGSQGPGASRARASAPHRPQPRPCCKARRRRSPHGHGDIARRREPAARHAAVAWWVRKRVDRRSCIRPVHQISPTSRLELA